MSGSSNYHPFSKKRTFELVSSLLIKRYYRLRSFPGKHEPVWLVKRYKGSFSAIFAAQRHKESTSTSRAQLIANDRLRCRVQWVCSLSRCSNWFKVNVLALPLHVISGCNVASKQMPIPFNDRDWNEKNRL